MSVSGALFDIVKILDISKTVISRYDAETVYNESLKWAKVYDEDLAKTLEDKEYALKVFGIERGNAKPRKDIAKWSDLIDNIGYMYEDFFFANKSEYDFDKINDKEEIRKILELYISKYYDENDDKQAWFDKLKDLSEELGYAREVKEYKQNPDAYKGHVGDISTVLRVALTSKSNTPDMYEIMQVLGSDKVISRLKSFE
jgi:glutamyl-tRNA synthetase